MAEIPCSIPVASEQNQKSTDGQHFLIERPLYVDEPSKVLQRCQLEAIASSSEIRDVLKDENIQKLIRDIDNSPDPENEFDNARGLEGFCLFTDKILSTLSP
ncbi:hypothetical protein TorRG33x02_299060 [Trema orientale]|uniref:Uncharacterized protein n=1 Tax=Trema orientale TaxID=63057 RepID=A0A2P5C3D2_TREOI|nr:hypothetical protein TorRG33x02_299060 [Trema orientale]